MPLPFALIVPDTVAQVDKADTPGHPAVRVPFYH